MRNEEISCLISPLRYLPLAPMNRTTFQLGSRLHKAFLRLAEEALESSDLQRFGLYRCVCNAIAQYLGTDVPPVPSSAELNDDTKPNPN